MTRNEWYFSDCYEALTKDLSSSDAFEAIPDVIIVLLTVKDTYLLSETLDFLDTVYNIANTTEIHPLLREEWRNIKQHIHRLGDDYSHNVWRKLNKTLGVSELF
ncbi:hypothetical protein SAMN05421663_109140 [Terribacillus halophilus]|uniref:Uncharacterized protein n=1 Tax=Terribacillus halophilus TaxID=361279 RepID=A0A1G6U459_9BACI|nr:hypothetical protein SAMN05421663_109140 [Terribacillus halophilus]